MSETIAPSRDVAARALVRVWQEDAFASAARKVTRISTAEGKRAWGSRATQRVNHGSKPGGMRCAQPSAAARCDADGSGSKSSSWSSIGMLSSFWFAAIQ